MNATMHRKVLMIGLDGATFDVVNPLIEAGRMPHLAKLIAGGACGRMVSTIPPISGPAWLSLATGMKPESTSIYDFTYRSGSSYELRNISSSDYAGRAVWDYLGDAGKTVGILNYPTLFPPYPVNGFLTSGLGASADDEFTFPADLRQELNRSAGGEYELYVCYHEPRYEDTELFLRDIHRALTKKLRAATTLAREKPWDFLWLVLSETDCMQHLLWQHLGKSGSNAQARRSQGFHKRFEELWGLIDQGIGELCAIAGPQTNVIVMSDHGFGPNEGVFKLNTWLEREGYLTWRKGQSRALEDAKEAVVAKIRAFARGIRLHKIAPSLYRRGRAARARMIEKIIEQIDLDKSIAFDPGHTIPFGGIYINDQVVTGPEKRRELAGEIERKLRDWARANNVTIEIWQRPVGRADSGPDLLVGVNDWGCVLLKEHLNGALFERRPYSSRHTGSHRMNGIFVAVGPDIRRGEVEPVHLCDVAPTVLHLFDVPVPASMDGRVRGDIVTDQYMSTHPDKPRSHGDGDEIREKTSRPREMTQREKDFMQQQLKDLGYM